MSEHPTDILGQTPEAVAEAVSRLRYDAMEAFFQALENRFVAASTEQEAAKRPALEFQSYRLSVAAQSGKIAANRAWQLTRKGPKP